MLRKISWLPVDGFFSDTTVTTRVFGEENPTPCTLAIVPESVAIAYRTHHRRNITAIHQTHKYKYLIYYKSIMEYNITSLLAESE
jgi:hypothetical protein